MVEVPAIEAVVEARADVSPILSTADVSAILSTRCIVACRDDGGWEDSDLALKEEAEDDLSSCP